METQIPTGARKSARRHTRKSTFNRRKWGLFVRVVVQTDANFPNEGILGAYERKKPNSIKTFRVTFSVPTLEKRILRVRVWENSRGIVESRPA